MWRRRTVLIAGAGLAARPAAGAAEPAFAAYERASGGRIGLYAENLATGAKLIWRADERFVMCSSFKASLAALVLRRVDRGWDRLDTPIAFGPKDVLEWYAPMARRNLGKGALSIEEMCAGAVEESDNTCANLLLARVGGPPAMTRFWREIGDGVTRLDHAEPELNRSPPGDPHDTTTPRAMAKDLQRLLLGDALESASRRRLTGWMLNCKTGADRLRAGVPAGWRIADKTGNNGKDAAGDIALLWTPQGRPIVVCVYVQGGAPSPAEISSAFAESARLVAARLA